MSIFISYSHSDKPFVDKLAASLVSSNSRIWLDRWELRIGDSLTQRIQQALEDSDAIVIVLSKASVASAWVTRELSAGLMRELEERRVLILPCVVDDCKIPLFLKDKYRADFRFKFAEPFKELRASLDHLTNPYLGRVQKIAGHQDFGLYWRSDDELGTRLLLTIVVQDNDKPCVCICELKIVLRPSTAVIYAHFFNRGEKDQATHKLLASVVDQLPDETSVELVYAEPIILPFQLTDPLTRETVDIEISTRRLGDDTGANLLVNIKELLQGSVANSLKKFEASSDFQ